ncbi:histidine phosphatase family protein [Thermodesulfobacteriota bacterium B35]
MARRLYLVRHSETTAADGALVGRTDVDVTARGLRALDRLAPLLPQGPCFCSPMLRTRRTLDRLRRSGVCMQAVFDERLREIDFGRWEEKTFAEIAETDSDLLDAWTAYTGFTFPGGESVASFVGRVEEMLALFREHPAPELVVISHGGVIRTMICLALGLPVRHYLLFGVRPASVCQVALYSQGGVLTGLNQRGGM